MLLVDVYYLRRYIEIIEDQWVDRWGCPSDRNATLGLIRYAKKFECLEEFLNSWNRSWINRFFFHVGPSIHICYLIEDYNYALDCSEWCTSRNGISFINKGEYDRFWYHDQKDAPRYDKVRAFEFYFRRIIENLDNKYKEQIIQDNGKSKYLHVIFKGRDICSNVEAYLTNDTDGKIRERINVTNWDGSEHLITNEKKGGFWIPLDILKEDNFLGGCI
ncbi:MAG: hypothetical protein ACOC3V_01805 [bacterium]